MGKHTVLEGETGDSGEVCTGRIMGRVLCSVLGQASAVIRESIYREGGGRGGPTKIEEKRDE